MGKIKVLPPHEAQKIAAGEVVDRPANVVKELLENSLDAGASHIILSCRDGGKTSISITDNGCGMSSEDAYLAIQNHATSKLSSFHELEHIQTFGFRGEALASIAAVSYMTLTTKTADMREGICLTLEGGILKQEIPIACNTGTTLEINNLFYNVPARQKFLKKTETEWNAIYTMVQALCLAHHTCGFTIIHNDHTVLHAPATHSLKERFAQIFENSLANSIVSCEHSDAKHNLTMSGIVSHPTYHRYDRNYLFFFVNNRWIKNHKLGQALIKAYASMLPAQRYPAAALFIKLDPTQVDINIHPRKEEVQFLHPRVVEIAIETMVHNALQEKIGQDLGKPSYIQHKQISSQPFRGEYPSTSKNISSSAALFTKTPAQPKTWQFGNSAEIPKPHVIENNNDLKPLNNFEQKTVVTEISTNNESICPTYQLIGQLHATYILIQTDEGLVMIDQHAAHERILYELFAQRFENSATTQLMFPHLITRSEQECTVLTSLLPIFKEHGILIEPLNNHQYLIKAVPVTLKNVALDEIISLALNIVNENSDISHKELLRLLHDKMRAMMACKAAIKAGDILEESQMHELIKKMYATDQRMTCPHGRPTTWKITLSEIERKFKRAE